MNTRAYGMSMGLDFWRFRETGPRLLYLYWNRWMFILLTCYYDQQYLTTDQSAYIICYFGLALGKPSGYQEQSLFKKYAQTYIMEVNPSILWNNLLWMRTTFPIVQRRPVYHPFLVWSILAPAWFTKELPGPPWISWILPGTCLVLYLAMLLVLAHPQGSASADLGWLMPGLMLEHRLGAWEPRDTS